MCLDTGLSLSDSSHFRHSHTRRIAYVKSTQASTMSRKPKKNGVKKKGQKKCSDFSRHTRTVCSLSNM